MAAPFYGDRPVSGWRFDLDERDALSFTLGCLRRARGYRATGAPRVKRAKAGAPAASSQADFEWTAASPDAGDRGSRP